MAIETHVTLNVINVVKEGDDNGGDDSQTSSQVIFATLKERNEWNWKVISSARSAVPTLHLAVHCVRQQVQSMARQLNQDDKRSIDYNKHNKRQADGGFASIAKAR